MVTLLSIFSVCAIGVAIILGAAFIGRLIYLLFKEVKNIRFAAEKLVIEERQKADLLRSIAHIEHGKAATLERIAAIEQQKLTLLERLRDNS